VRQPQLPDEVVDEVGLVGERRLVPGQLLVGEAAVRRRGVPLVLVVGEVVSLRERLRWFDALPLFGRRVLVTRAREQASALTSLLEEQGARVWELPTIAIVPPISM
jgi:uroporphyrinogen III methyltransferase/synthase